VGPFNWTELYNTWPQSKIIIFKDRLKSKSIYLSKESQPTNNPCKNGRASDV
jgi:hypothetical protein